MSCFKEFLGEKDLTQYDTIIMAAGAFDFSNAARSNEVFSDSAHSFPLRDFTSPISISESETATRAKDFLYFLVPNHLLGGSGSFAEGG